jgi:hypothetical protein
VCSSDLFGFVSLEMEPVSCWCIFLLQLRFCHRMAWRSRLPSAAPLNILGLFVLFRMSQVSSVATATGLISEGSGFDFLQGQGICLFSTVSGQALWPIILPMVTEGQNGRGVKLTTHLCVLPRLKIRRFVPLLHLMSWCVINHRDNFSVRNYILLGALCGGHACPCLWIGAYIIGRMFLSVGLRRGHENWQEISIFSHMNSERNLLYIRS